MLIANLTESRITWEKGLWICLLRVILAILTDWEDISSLWVGTFPEQGMLDDVKWNWIKVQQFAFVPLCLLIGCNGICFTMHLLPLFPYHDGLGLEL